jgi:hypothetical protein
MICIIDLDLFFLSNFSTFILNIKNNEFFIFHTYIKGCKKKVNKYVYLLITLK